MMVFFLIWMVYTGWKRLGKARLLGLLKWLVVGTSYDKISRVVGDGGWRELEASGKLVGS